MGYGVTGQGPRCQACIVVSRQNFDVIAGVQHKVDCGIDPVSRALPRHFDDDVGQIADHIGVVACKSRQRICRRAAGVQDVVARVPGDQLSQCVTGQVDRSCGRAEDGVQLLDVVIGCQHITYAGRSPVGRSATGDFVDDRASVTDIVNVVACQTSQGICHPAAVVQLVRPGVAGDRLGQRIAGQVDRHGTSRIVGLQNLNPRPGGQRKGTRCNHHVIGAFACHLGHYIRGVRDDKGVVAQAAKQFVVACAAAKRVIASQTVDPLVRHSASQHIIASRAVDRGTRNRSSPVNGEFACRHDQTRSQRRDLHRCPGPDPIGIIHQRPSGRIIDDPLVRCVRSPCRVRCKGNRCQSAARCQGGENRIAQFDLVVSHAVIGDRVNVCSPDGRAKDKGIAPGVAGQHVHTALAVQPVVASVACDGLGQQVASQVDCCRQSRVVRAHDLNVVARIQHKADRRRNHVSRALARAFNDDIASVPDLIGIVPGQARHRIGQPAASVKDVVARVPGHVLGQGVADQVDRRGARAVDRIHLFDVIISRQNKSHVGGDPVRCATACRLDYDRAGIVDIIDVVAGQTGQCIACADPAIVQ